MEGRAGEIDYFRIFDLHLGSHLLTRCFVQAERTVLIAVRGAGEAVRVWRRFGQHPIVRGNAGFVGNALRAALQTGALVAAASPGAAARLIPAVAPEPEQVAILPGDDRAGGVMTRLPFFRRQVVFAFAHGNNSPSRGAKRCLHPPPRKWGRGTIRSPQGGGWWKGREPRRFFGDDGDTSSQTPLPPPFADFVSGGWSPFPATAGQEDRHRSRDASPRPSFAYDNDNTTLLGSPPAHA